MLPSLGSAHSCLCRKLGEIKNKHNEKERNPKKPLCFGWKMSFFSGKGTSLPIINQTNFTELKASTFGHIHFPLETQRQSTQHERQTDVWLPLAASGANSLSLETAERVGGQEGAGWRGSGPGCHSLAWPQCHNLWHAAGQTGWGMPLPPLGKSAWWCQELWFASPGMLPPAAIKPPL